MKIIFASNTCSMKEYNYLQSIKTNSLYSPSQKFYDMFIRGFDDENISIACITTRMIDTANCGKSFLARKLEQVSKNIKYYYIKIININKYLRKINNIIEVFVTINAIIKSSKDKNIIFCDILAWDAAIGAFLSAILNKTKIGVFVTDIPGFFQNNKSNKSIINDSIKMFIDKILNLILCKFDYYGFITESMNKLININNKPYFILEGMVYAENIENIVIDNHVDKNIVLYAGALFEQFGIKKLVDACCNIDIDCELYLYGEGDCVDYIKKISRNNPKIKYKGVVSLDEITLAERKAKLLVNPRPSSELCTKYSFPSKTLEYMSVARPIITTKLEGIPKEYYKYLFTFEGETVDEIRNTIKRYLKMDCNYLDQCGLNNFLFVQKFKNNKFQLKGIEDFFRAL